jgi:NAD(P)-dependent dehydrogenase (short-subunit alcohol dehydrogenase family)
MAIHRALCEAGARVVTVSRSSDNAAEAKEIAEEAGVKTTHLQCDITDAAQCEQTIAAATEQFGALDGLVNNAFASGLPQPMEDSSIEKTWSLPFKVNVFGTMKMTRAAIPALREGSGKSIVTINSMAARRVPEGMTPYAASKAALLTAMQGVAQEFGIEGIRANSVLPSHIDGPNLEMLLTWESQKRDISREQVRDEIIAEGVLDHITTPAEIADTVVFLLSAQSRGVTGQSIDVNAGQCFV